MQTDEISTTSIKKLTNTSESHNLALPSLLVSAPPISLLAVLKGSSNVNKEESSSTGTSILEDVLLGGVTRSLVRGNGGGDDGGSGARELGCD